MTHDKPVPKVFLIGDSIAGGYGPQVQHVLADEVQIQLRPENGKDSRHVLSRAIVWLAGEYFDVIHFNCGLHDIKRPRDSNIIQVPIEEYQTNLQRIVNLLGQYADVLVWARTTPVINGHPNPKKSFDRFNRDVDAYNHVADQVMAAHGIAINDLHGAVREAGGANCLSQDGVHMTEAGYGVLAREVATAIRTALAPNTSYE